MATLATGLLASFGRTGLSLVGFLQVVPLRHFWFPHFHTFSQRDSLVATQNILLAQLSLRTAAAAHIVSAILSCRKIFS